MSHAIVVIPVTSRPHEYRVVTVIVVQDRHALGQALVVIGSGEDRDAAVVVGDVAQLAAERHRCPIARDVNLIPEHVGGHRVRSCGRSSAWLVLIAARIGNPEYRSARMVRGGNEILIVPRVVPYLVCSTLITERVEYVAISIVDDQRGRRPRCRCATAKRDLMIGSEG
jgi:hypothetical protein